jgi:hypothetical protein
LGYARDETHRSRKIETKKGEKEGGGQYKTNRKGGKAIKN